VQDCTDDVKAEQKETGYGIKGTDNNKKYYSECFAFIETMVLK
jgi:hypothetical protein